MRIEVDTKYNEEDKVFYIQLVDKYNDYYNSELEWDISRAYDRRTKPKAFKIMKIRIYVMGGKECISYLVNNTWVSEQHIYLDEQEALKECKRLNSECIKNI